MSDNATVPAGAANTAAPVSVDVTDESSAADFLARSGLFGELLGEEEPREEQDSADEADTGPHESEATGEEEGQSEPEPETPPAPAIEPPKSWSDEEKAEFGKLPPAAQKIIAERESERDRAFTQKTTEVAETRRALEQASAAIHQERANYVQNIETMLLTILPEKQQLDNIDWRRLGAEQPAEAVRLDGIKKDIDNRWAAAQREMARIRQAAAQQQQYDQAQLLQREIELLHQNVPELKDTKTAQQLNSWLQSQGFSDREVGQLLDHRVAKVAFKAMLHDQAEAARKTAQAKTAAPTPPRVQKPGTAPETADAASRRVRDDIGRFRQSGDMKDAARLLEHIF